MDIGSYSNMEISIVQIQFFCIAYNDIFTDNWLTRGIIAWWSDGANLETGMKLKKERKEEGKGEKRKEKKCDNKFNLF